MVGSNRTSGVWGGRREPNVPSPPGCRTGLRQSARWCSWVGNLEATTWANCSGAGTRRPRRGASPKTWAV
eukprot:7625833-Pyramimonas_sp.AAC.1